MSIAAQRARRLRRNLTKAEAVLWRGLRSRQLASAKFRRQQPVDGYVADFLSFEHRLIVEVDGGQHAGDGAERRRHLEAQGFRILRFWNNEVLGNLEGVLERIRAVIGGEA